MLGYGPESSHFHVELIYNYGVSSYDLGDAFFHWKHSQLENVKLIFFVYIFFLQINLTGNDFNGIKIQAAGIIDRAKKENYPFSVEDNNNYILRSPDGYTFYVTDEQQPNDDPVQGIVFNTNDLQKTQSYWTDMLTMKLVKQSDNEACLTYTGNQAKLFYRKTGKF